MISGRGCAALGGQRDRGLGDRPDLHREQAGDDQAEAYAAQAEHRVLLVHPAHRGEHLLVLGVVLAALLGDRDVHGELLQRGQELVQRRVDQPDGHRQAVHRPEDLEEVGALQRLQRGQGVAAVAVGARQDQPFDQLAAVAEEHVLGAAQADALRRRTAGPGRRRRRCRRWCAPRRRAAVVGVRHDPVHGGDQRLVGQRRVEVALEVLHHLGRAHRHRAEVDPAGGAVDRDDVALVDDVPADGELVAAAPRSASAPQTQVLPMPRATTAAWRSCRRGRSGCPGRRSCRAGRRGWSPGGPGSPARPRRRARPRAAAVKTTSPTAAPGRGADAPW